MNARGNLYSCKHVTLSPNSDAFWQFSWHEIGVYDVPATIDYILFKTNQPKIFHIGHSQGCTTFYVMTSQNPEYNNKIIAHFSLAPAVYMEFVPNPVLHAFAALVLAFPTTVSISIYIFQDNCRKYLINCFI